jgi:23S rRNA (guanosine2251-2'-O)-methyltransferase
MRLEGRHAVAEALRADMPLKSVQIAEGTKPDRLLSEIERACAAKGVRVARVSRRELDARSEHGAHQGVMAEASPYKFVALSDLIDRASGAESALVIALDHVTDPGNLGAIVRTAEVVGAVGVLVTERRSAAITPAAWKAAAGALAHVPIAQETNLARALEQLKQAGFWIAGASERASDTVWEAPLEGRIVVVMGSEGSGLARLTEERCDFLARLPQAGKVGSLNVAQAATAVAYEWLRRTQRSGGSA